MVIIRLKGCIHDFSFADFHKTREETAILGEDELRQLGSDVVAEEGARSTAEINIIGFLLEKPLSQSYFLPTSAAQPMILVSVPRQNKLGLWIISKPAYRVDNL